MRTSALNIPFSPAMDRPVISTHPVHILVTAASLPFVCFEFNTRHSFISPFLSDARYHPCHRRHCLSFLSCFIRHLFPLEPLARFFLPLVTRHFHFLLFLPLLNLSARADAQLLSTSSGISSSNSRFNRCHSALRIA